MFFVYILECSDNTYYTGYTNNLEKRILAHQNKKGAKYTKGRTPIKLVYYEVFQTKSEALSREYFIKKLTKSQKISLIQNKNLKERINYY